MFGLWRKRHTNVFAHWYVLLPDTKGSTDKFYQDVISEMQRRQIPALETTRMVLLEGEMFGPRREYLRMRRERLVFDVCSGGFGTCWFFSCRLAEIPFRIRWWEILILAFLLYALYSFYPRVFGPGWGMAIFAMTAIGTLVLLNALATTPTRDVDSMIMPIPVIGTLYELFLRRNNSYYREDARNMYIDLVNSIVRQKVDEFGKEMGFENIEFRNVDDPVSPVSFLDNLRFRTAEVLTPPTVAAAAAAEAVFDVVEKGSKRK